MQIMQCTRLADKKERNTARKANPVMPPVLYSLPVRKLLVILSSQTATAASGFHTLSGVIGGYISAFHNWVFDPIHLLNAVVRIPLQTSQKYTGIKARKGIKRSDALSQL